MLNEISQSEYILYDYVRFLRAKLTEAANRMGVAMGQKEWEMGSCYLKNINFQLHKMT